MLRSVDSMSEEDRIYYAYPIEFLQQLNASRLPSALLCLKVGCSVILLRNLDPGEGLCNGTRMVSQTSFSHISINSSTILTVSIATKSPQKTFQLIPVMS